MTTDPKQAAEQTYTDILLGRATREGRSQETDAYPRIHPNTRGSEPSRPRKAD